MKRIFVRSILISFFFITGACTSLSTSRSDTTPASTNTSEASEEKAFSVARSACNTLHSEEIEHPNNVKAVLTTIAEARNMLGNESGGYSPMPTVSNLVWFVQLTGKWQLSGGPAPISETPNALNLPVSTPTLWNTCDVIIDPNGWQTLQVQQMWNKAIP